MVKKSLFNPLITDSSINSSKDEKEILMMDEPRPKDFPSSPSDHSPTPSVSINITKDRKEDFLPSFKVTEEHQLLDKSI